LCDRRASLVPIGYKNALKRIDLLEVHKICSTIYISDTDGVILACAVRHINVSERAATSMTLDMKEDCLFRSVHHCEGLLGQSFRREAGFLEVQETMQHI
jgi:hypothetical protein